MKILIYGDPNMNNVHTDWNILSGKVTNNCRLLKEKHILWEIWTSCTAVHCKPEIWTSFTVVQCEPETPNDFLNEITF